MNKKTRTFFSLQTGALVLATVFVLLPNDAHAAWSEPDFSPPGGNISAPLNISVLAQTKAGNLTIERTLVVGQALSPYAVLATLSNTLSAYNATAAAKNALAGYKSGTGVAGSGVYGELDADLTCSLNGVCSAIYGSDGSLTPDMPGKWAGYFNGAVNINGTLTVDKITINGNTTFVQCPPHRVPVHESRQTKNDWIQYDSCEILSTDSVVLTNPQVCHEFVCARIQGYGVNQNAEATCMEFGLTKGSTNTGSNTSGAIYDYAVSPSSWWVYSVSIKANPVTSVTCKKGDVTVL